MATKRKPRSTQFNFPKPGEPLWDLYVAFDYGDLSAMKSLLTRHEDLKTDENLSLILINGIRRNCAETVEFALAEKADVNHHPRGGDTALGMAVRRGNYKMFVQLLKAGGNPHETDADGRSLRDLAEECDLAGAEKIAKMLDDPQFIAASKHLKK